jgi:hypothetical protein
MDEDDYVSQWIPVLEAPVRWPQRRWLESLRRLLQGPAYDEPPVTVVIAQWRGEPRYEVTVQDRNLNEWAPVEMHPDIEAAKAAAVRLVGGDRLGAWSAKPSG